MLKAFDGANNAIKMAINLRLLVWFINLFDKEEKGSIFPGNTESTDELKKQIFKWHMRNWHMMVSGGLLLLILSC